jgi:hypothetical protein
VASSCYGKSCSPILWTAPSEYPQSDNPFSVPSSYDYPPKQSSLEETLKEFIQLTGQSLQEIIDATMANTEAIVRLEGQLGHLVVEFNRIEEDEFQSQEMTRGQYMIDDDCPSDPHHEHVQATTTNGSEEVVDEIFCEPSLEDWLEERFDQFGDDLDLDKLLDHADTFCEPSLEDPSGECFDQIECNLDFDEFLKQAVMHREPSLEDPLEESFAKFEFDLDLDMIHEQDKALLDPTPKMWTENGEEENQEQIEPPPILNWSNDKEVSTEAHSFITIPLETQHEPQALSFQCLEKPSYVEIFKVSCTVRCKYRNRYTKNFFRSKLLGYIRWRNILPEGYHILKKKGWKGLVGQLYERGRCSNFFIFIFRTLFLSHFIFIILFFVILFCF